MHLYLFLFLGCFTIGNAQDPFDFEEYSYKLQQAVDAARNAFNYPTRYERQAPLIREFNSAKYDLNREKAMIVSSTGQITYEPIKTSPQERLAITAKLKKFSKELINISKKDRADFAALLRDFLNIAESVVKALQDDALATIYKTLDQYLTKQEILLLDDGSLENIDSLFKFYDALGMANNFISRLNQIRIEYEIKNRSMLARLTHKIVDAQINRILRDPEVETAVRQAMLGDTALIPTINRWHKNDKRTRSLANALEE